MSDTAQPLAAADPIAEAAAAFKASFAPPPEETPVARDEKGRFAPATEIEPEEEAAEPVTSDDSAEQETEAEAAEEAQPEADVPLPASWPKEDAETWNALPPEARAIIAEREGQRDAAINQKFQEAANVRKAALAAAQAAEASRQAYEAQLEQVIGLITPAAPDPAHYVDADGQFNGNQYAWDRAQYDKAQEAASQLRQQREAISAQRDEEARESLRTEWEQNGERLSAIPDFAPDRLPLTVAALERFATQTGIPADTLAMATPLEVEILWKAMQYDRAQEAKTRVAPVAKPARPNVRPGVSTPKAAVINSQRQAAMAKLAKSGSVEDAAFFFKTYKGT